MNTITNEQQHFAKFANLQLVLQLAGTKLRKASGQWLDHCFGRECHSTERDVLLRPGLNPCP